MYIPFAFTGASSGSLSLNGLKIWNSYGGYDASAGTWEDLSGNGNSGSVFGTLTDNGGTYGFNGINNAVFYNKLLGEDPNLVFNMTISVMGTFYTADNIDRPLWYNYDSVGVESGFRQILRNSYNPDDIVFRTFTGGTPKDYTSTYTLTSGETAMFTIAGNAFEIYLYKNANKIATWGPDPFGDPYYYAANTVAPFGNAQLNFGYGQSGGPATNTFSGSVSNLLFYNRTLTDNEVANNWNYLIGSI